MGEGFPSPLKAPKKYRFQTATRSNCHHFQVEMINRLDSFGFRTRIFLPGPAKTSPRPNLTCCLRTSNREKGLDAKKLLPRPFGVFLPIPVRPGNCPRVGLPSHDGKYSGLLNDLELGVHPAPYEDVTRKPAVNRVALLRFLPHRWGDGIVVGENTFMTLPRKDPGNRFVLNVMPSLKGHARGAPRRMGEVFESSLFISSLVHQSFFRPPVT